MKRAFIKQIVDFNLGEKRLALLSEIQSLKQKKAGKQELHYKACTGAIIINTIRLPLRTEYIFSLANKREAGRPIYYEEFVIYPFTEW